MAENLPDKCTSLVSSREITVKSRNTTQKHASSNSVTRRIYGCTELARAKDTLRNASATPKHIQQKLLCGNCGASFRSMTNKNVKYWLCRTHAENTGLCSVSQIPEAEIEEAFLRLCYN